MKLRKIVIISFLVTTCIFVLSCSGTEKYTANIIQKSVTDNMSVNVLINDNLESDAVNLSIYNVHYLDVDKEKVKRYFFLNKEYKVEKTEFSYNIFNTESNFEPVAMIGINDASFSYSTTNAHVLRSLTQANKGSHMDAYFEPHLNKKLLSIDSTLALKTVSEAVSEITDMTISDCYYIFGHTNEDLKAAYDGMSQSVTSRYGADYKERLFGSSFPFSDEYECYYIILFADIEGVKIDNSILSFSEAPKGLEESTLIVPPMIHAVYSSHGIEILVVSSNISLEKKHDAPDVISKEQGIAILNTQFEKAMYPETTIELIEYRYIIKPMAFSKEKANNIIATPVIYFEGKQKMINSEEDIFFTYYLDAITGKEVR